MVGPRRIEGYYGIGIQEAWEFSSHTFTFFYFYLRELIMTFLLVVCLGLDKFLTLVFLPQTK